MLVLGRHEGASVRIGDDIVVRVLRIDGGVIRLGIEAPRPIQVDRQECRGLAQGSHSTAARSVRSR